MYAVLTSAYDDRTAVPRGGLPSVISLAFAVLSFATGALVGFLAAISAVAIGVVGVLVAMASIGRGGTIAAATVGIGTVGVVAALFKLIV